MGVLFFAKLSIAASLVHGSFNFQVNFGNVLLYNYLYTLKTVLKQFLSRGIICLLYDLFYIKIIKKKVQTAHSALLFFELWTSLQKVNNLLKTKFYFKFELHHCCFPPFINLCGMMVEQKHLCNEYENNV